MSHQLKLYSTQINEYMFTRDANKIHTNNNKLDTSPFAFPAESPPDNTPAT